MNTTNGDFNPDNPRITLSKCENASVIELPKIPDIRGNLTFIEGSNHIPFEIKRVFYLYDVPGGAERAGHALKSCSQFIIAIAGSFDVRTDDGFNTAMHHLNRSYYGLYLKPLTWRVINNFSTGAICLVLASEPYQEDDYYRDYDSFKKNCPQPQSP